MTSVINARYTLTMAPNRHAVVQLMSWRRCLEYSIAVDMNISFRELRLIIISEFMFKRISSILSLMTVSSKPSLLIYVY